MWAGVVVFLTPVVAQDQALIAAGGLLSTYASLIFVALAFWVFVSGQKAPPAKRAAKVCVPLANALRRLGASAHRPCNPITPRRKVGEEEEEEEEGGFVVPAPPPATPSATAKGKRRGSRK